MDSLTWPATAAMLLLCTLLASCDAPRPTGSDAGSTGATGAISSAPGATRAPGWRDFVDVESRSVAEYLAAPAFADADLERGELLAFACRACHALRAGEENDMAPPLAGVFGRPAGATAFDYSAAMRAVTIVWTPAALDAWLASPAGFVPETKMAFTGYRSAEDRRDLIAYLLRETS